jgi:transposase
MEVVYLKSQGLKHKEISQLCRVSKDSVTPYLKMYRDGGLEGLKKWDYQGKENELLAHEDMLKDYFRVHPPRSIAQARAAIEEITGISRSLGCRNLGHF